PRRLHQAPHRLPAPHRAPAPPFLPRLRRLREGAGLPPRRPPDPRLGRDRRLPAARQHQPARRLLRRLLHRARRAAAPARHGARELPLRLRGAAARRLPRGLRGLRQPGRDRARHPPGLAVGAGRPRLPAPQPAHGPQRPRPQRRPGRGSSADSTGAPGSAAARRLQQQNNTEGGLDPFLYPGFLDLSRKGPVQGKVLQRDTFNFAAGLDLNRFVRWLNPAQTIFITTQFFYKHVFDSPGDLVLPVPFRLTGVDKTIPIIGNGCGPKNARRACRLEPRLFHLDDDRFLHTLLVTTSYY